MTPLAADRVCYFPGCDRHGAAEEVRPVWLDDDVADALCDWYESAVFTEAENAAAAYATIHEFDLRDRFVRDAADIRKSTETILVRSWADDERHQAAVRYWSKRQQRRQVPVRRGGGERGRFNDPVVAFAEVCERVRWSGVGFVAKCPAHQDRSPSLSVSRGSDDRMLLHCFAGCSPEAVLGAVGWRFVDMFVST
jgi:hypothetical protein